MKKKGQVNIDLILSALMFFAFLMVLLSMIMRTTNPFLNEVSQDVYEKRRDMLVSELPREFNSIDELCAEEFSSFDDLSFSYTLSLIPLPGWDKKTSKGNLSIVRRDYRLVLNASGSSNLPLKFKFPESVRNITKDVNASRDYYGNWIYEFRMDDEVVEIDAGTHQNWFTVNKSQGVYLGEIPLNDSCGTTTGQFSYYKFNSILKKRGDIFPVDLKVYIHG